MLYDLKQVHFGPLSRFDQRTPQQYDFFLRIFRFVPGAYGALSDPRSVTILWTHASRPIVWGLRFSRHTKSRKRQRPRATLILFSCSWWSHCVRTFNPCNTLTAEQQVDAKTYAHLMYGESPDVRATVTAHNRHLLQMSTLFVATALF